MPTVTNLNDSGAGSLRDTLASAAPGDTIDFSVTGTITLTSAELTISQNQTIEGPGSGQLTINRDSGAPAFRIFNLTAGVISISGLTISGGNSTDGGGIQNATTLTLEDVIVTRNYAATSAGGIYNQSTITFVGANEVTSNTCDGDGGGLLNDGTVIAGNASMIVSDNSAAGAGGGIWNQGTLTFTGRLENNSAIGNGGGAYNAGTITFTLSAIIGNTGVGIYSSFGTVSLSRSAVTNNTGHGTVNSFGTLYHNTCTTSTNGGYGILNDGGSGDFDNSTVALNGAAGIAFSNDGVFTCFDTIVVGNTTTDVDNTSGTLTSDGHNLFGFSTSPITPNTGDLFGYTFVTAKLGPLQDNGGPTLTHALLNGSPAIDAGDNTDVGGTDQRLYPRIVNGTVDIGAYESPIEGCTLFINTTLPGWLEKQGDCLVVKPGVFRGATKAEADAKAQAALDAYYDAALASGDIECTGVDCAACDEAITGELEDTFTTTNFQYFAAYSDNSRRLWFASQDYNVPIEIFDAQTGAAALEIPLLNANCYALGLGYNPQSGKVYVVFIDDDDGGNTKAFVIDAISLQIEDTITSPTAINSRLLFAYDPEHDRLYMSPWGFDRHMYWIDCATNTWNSTANFFIDSAQENYCVWAESKSSIYITNFGGKIYEMSTATNAIVATVDASSFPWVGLSWPLYNPSNGHIYITQKNGFGDGQVLDFNTVTNTVDNVFDIFAITGHLFAPTGAATYNTCTGKILLTTGTGDSDMLYFNPSDSSFTVLPTDPGYLISDGVYASCEKRSFFTDAMNNNFYKFT